MLYDMFTAEGTHMQKDEVKYAYEYLGFEKALNRLQQEVEKRQKHIED